MEEKKTLKGFWNKNKKKIMKIGGIVVATVAGIFVVHKLTSGESGSEVLDMIGDGVEKVGEAAVDVGEAIGDAAQDLIGY
jgi:hypothetical protein